MEADDGWLRSMSTCELKELAATSRESTGTYPTPSDVDNIPYEHRTGEDAYRRHLQLGLLAFDRKGEVALPVTPTIQAEVVFFSVCSYGEDVSRNAKYWRSER